MTDQAKLDEELAHVIHEATQSRVSITEAVVMIRKMEAAGWSFTNKAAEEEARKLEAEEQRKKAEAEVAQKAAAAEAKKRDEAVAWQEKENAKAAAAANQQTADRFEAQAAPIFESGE
jgi:hypothetical protein